MENSLHNMTTFIDKIIQETLEETKEQRAAISLRIRKEYAMKALRDEMLEALELLMKAEPMQQGERNGYIMGVISTAIDKARNVILKTKNQS